ncbi:MAG: hypothetical protein ACYSUQ_08525 [Planctomycetota bacterium]
MRKNVNIIIAGDVIRSLSTGAWPENVRVVDISGKCVIPGLFDLLAHIQPLREGRSADSPQAAPDRPTTRSISHAASRLGRPFLRGHRHGSSPAGSY